MNNNGNNNDTICAIATASGAGAIAVIRLSGAEAVAVCNAVFRGKDLLEQPSHTLHFGTIRDGKEIIDEVLVALFRGPNSYTGEDVIEISCHGSVFIQQRMVKLFLEKGARLANPGEFTMRAFMNGKLDLSQAEAVSDLIASGSEAAHKIAIQQMRGGFSGEIEKLREALIDFASLIELELDFSEEDVEFANREDLKALIIKMKTDIQHLVDSFSAGNVIKNGIPVVIAGKPNVGKSTLLNALLNEERAIVSEIAGTTRDAIEDEIILGGISFRFIDTAGLRETRDTVEATGVKKTLEKIKTSAVVMYVFDVHELTSRELSGIVKDLKKETAKTGAKLILVGNKIDREDRQAIRKEYAAFEKLSADQGGMVLISARERQNLDKLSELLLNMVNTGSLQQGETIVTNSRHYEALSKAGQALDKVHQGLDSHITGDFLAADIRQALHHLGEITGQITTDDLLGNIFGKFCIGK